MNDRLAGRVYPTILYVLELVDRIHGRRPGGMPDPKEEFPRLKQYLGQLDAGRATREDELTKAALVYWIDEVLVNSPWPHANYWKDHTLEREFFDSRDRAWEFFEKAKTARTMSPPDALEAYYLCVAMGFKGIYRDGEVRPATKPPAAKPAPPRPSAPAAPRKTMDSWFGDASTDDNWDLPETEEKPLPTPPDDMIDESVFAAPKGSLQQGGLDLPPTLTEWASPVFAQIAPGRQRGFMPETAADSPREARPLAGWAACQRSIVALVWTLLVTLVLIVVWIVRSYS